MAWQGVAWCDMALNSTVLYGVVLYGVAWRCTVLHGIEWLCVALHNIALHVIQGIPKKTLFKDFCRRCLWLKSSSSSPSLLKIQSFNPKVHWSDHFGTAHHHHHCHCNAVEIKIWHICCWDHNLEKFAVINITNTLKTPLKHPSTPFKQP